MLSEPICGFHLCHSGHSGGLPSIPVLRQLDDTNWPNHLLDRSRRCQCGRAPPFPPLTHTCLLHFTAPAATYLCSHKIMFPRCQTPDGQSFCLGGRLARRVTAKSVQRGLRPSPGKTSEKEEIQHPAQHQLGRVIIVIHKARSVLYMCDRSLTTVKIIMYESQMKWH